MPRLISCATYPSQIFPTERHSLRHMEASDHYETTLLSFLQSNL